MKKSSMLCGPKPSVHRVPASPNGLAKLVDLRGCEVIPGVPRGTTEESA